MADESIDNLGRWPDFIMQQVTTSPNVFPVDKTGRRVLFIYQNVTNSEIMEFAVNIHLATMTWRTDLHTI